MRILLVSYHLYPDGTSEGLCVAKTARALADAGHEVTVLTSDRSSHSGAAERAEAVLLSGLSVHRIAADPALTPAWADPFYRLSGASPGQSWLASRVAGRASAVPNLILGCNREEYSWVAAASKQIADAWNLAKPGFDVIHSRLNHSNSHLAVLAALPRLSTPAPWSAHFSDPWPHHLYPEPYRSKVGPLFRRRLEGILERILRDAGSLTFPGERLMRFVLSGDRAIHRAKAQVVPHLGNVWLPREQAPENDKFSILFAGVLLQQRNPANFFKALQFLFAQHPEARDKTIVRFVGRTSASLDEPIREFGLQGVVVATPRVSFDDAWAWMCRSHVLLLVESPMEEGIFMPSKLADYLSVRRPILALSPPVGTVADLLASGGGIRADPDNPPQIAEALSELYLRWQNGNLDELRPTAAQADYVSPSAIAAAYESAFRQAMRATERGVAALRDSTLQAKVS